MTRTFKAEEKVVEKLENFVLNAEGTYDSIFEVLISYDKEFKEPNRRKEILNDPSVLDKAETESNNGVDPKANPAETNGGEGTQTTSASVELSLPVSGVTQTLPSVVTTLAGSSATEVRSAQPIAAQNQPVAAQDQGQKGARSKQPPARPPIQNQIIRDMNDLNQHLSRLSSPNNNGFTPLSQNWEDSIDNDFLGPNLAGLGASWQQDRERNLLDVRDYNSNYAQNMAQGGALGDTQNTQARRQGSRGHTIFDNQAPNPYNFNIPRTEWTDASPHQIPSYMPIQGQMIQQQLQQQQQLIQQLLQLENTQPNQQWFSYNNPRSEWEKTKRRGKAKIKIFQETLANFNEQTVSAPFFF